MTLYLKYRSKNLDELDLPEVRDSLKKIIQSGRIPHAFLFAGTKGTGKTSAARILAKVVNCENLSKDGVPCEKCEQCVSITKGTNLDVIEMDAASHRGIDDVRALRDAVKLAPTRAKKKVYIIDEAHMLTTEASNALLKTLEEPPEHVIFILATTNPEKLIETIRSRTTFIPFRKPKTSEIVESLKRVIAGEKIKIKEDALEIIAEASGGAFRDAIKILEQLVAENRVLTREFLEEHLYKNKSFDTDHFIDLLAARDTKNLIIEIGKLGPSGVTIDVFLDSLLSRLRAGILGKVGIGEDTISLLNQNELVELAELFSEASRKVADSLIEELPLELAVIKWCGNKKPDARKMKSEDEVRSMTEEDRNGSSKIEPQASTFSSQDPTSDVESRTSTSEAGVEEMKNLLGEEVWKNILFQVKPVNASIEALLRAAKPISYDGKTLTLGVYYKFHKERLEDVHHRLVLEDIIAKVLQSPTKVVCTLVEPPVKKVVEEAKIEPVLTEGKDQDIIKVAEEIFGN